MNPITGSDFQFQLNIQKQDEDQFNKILMLDKRMRNAKGASDIQDSFGSKNQDFEDGFNQNQNQNQNQNSFDMCTKEQIDMDDSGENKQTERVDNIFGGSDCIRKNINFEQNERNMNKISVQKNINPNSRSRSNQQKVINKRRNISPEQQQLQVKNNRGQGIVQMLQAPTRSQAQILVKKESGSDSENSVQLTHIDFKKNTKITDFYTTKNRPNNQFENKREQKNKKINQKTQKQFLQKISPIKDSKKEFHADFNTKENYQYQDDLDIKQLKMVTMEQEQTIKTQDKTIRDRDTYINQIQEENKQFREQLTNHDEKSQMGKRKAKEVIKDVLLENENQKRQIQKYNLAHKKQRIGEYVNQRDGAQFRDIWIDGYELKEMKTKIAQLDKQIEELETKRKNLKVTKKNACINVQNSKQMELNFQSYNNPGHISAQHSNDNSCQEVIENVQKCEEQKKKIACQCSFLQKDKQLSEDNLQYLEHEKFLFIKQLKRQYEEDHCRYAKASSEIGPWPVISKYQILALLGKGGFSEVYKGYDLDELIYTAVKIHQLNPNWSENSKGNYIKHALRENNVHKELSHPNIVKLFDTVEIDANSFGTILEYCDGVDLSHYMKTHKQISEKNTWMIMKQVLSALKYLNMHKTKVIHYDLKPQNILFHKGEVKISDFGLCKVMEDDSTRLELTSQGVGTYWYLPPECFLVGDQPPSISAKVDVWSLGVIYYEMLFGMKPFGNQMSQEKILKEQIILNCVLQFPSKPVISPECKEFLKRCLAYHQKDRFDVAECWNSAYIQTNKK